MPSEKDQAFAVEKSALEKGADFFFFENTLLSRQIVANDSVSL
jgi:hypothetical protein